MKPALGILLTILAFAVAIWIASALDVHEPLPDTLAESSPPREDYSTLQSHLFTLVRGDVDPMDVQFQSISWTKDGITIVGEKGVPDQFLRDNFSQVEIDADEVWRNLHDGHTASRECLVQMLAVDGRVIDKEQFYVCG